jgi:large conductance mechanosensitive channel
VVIRVNLRPIFGEKVMSKLSNFGNEFKKFAIRGNMVDMAVGFTVGVAFSAIARSLVDDIIMPFVGLLFGDSQFNDFYILLREGAGQPGPYLTLVDAQAAGAITVNLGLFINTILTFLIIAFVMFFVVRGMNRLESQLDELTDVEEKPGEPTDRDCPYCFSSVPLQASRCPYCTSELKPLAPEGAPG